MTAPNKPAALLPCRSCGRTYAAEVLVCPTDKTVLPLENRLLDGKFRLDLKIGDGGMASVWQATNTRVAKPVAIKLMHARYASDGELLARFRNEASAAGKIGSEHICDVLDFGESPIGPYIVLELLEGCSLAELIQQHRRLDPGLAVWIVRQALAGLAAAHRAGIVHRDLKPENIHLSRTVRGQWIIKLMDFGISKFTQDPNTAAGATLGTPHYMAPEQIQNASKVDARADLWSIGVILYEALTGVQLFARENVSAALAALRTYEPPPLTQHLPSAPRGLAEVIAKCLVRAPNQRVQSADALAQALAPFEVVNHKAAEAAAASSRAARVQKQAARAARGPTGPQPAVSAMPQPASFSFKNGPTGSMPQPAKGPMSAAPQPGAKGPMSAAPQPAGAKGPMSAAPQPVGAKGPLSVAPQAAVVVRGPGSAGAGLAAAPAGKIGLGPGAGRQPAPAAAVQRAVPSAPLPRPAGMAIPDDELRTVPMPGAKNLGQALGVDPNQPPTVKAAPARPGPAAPARRVAPRKAGSAPQMEPWMWGVVAAIVGGLFLLIVVLLVR